MQVLERTDLRKRVGEELTGRFLSFTFIDWRTAEVLYAVPFGFDGWVAVIGNPDNAAYEWVGRVDGEFSPATTARPELRRSDDGYGDPATAMRDGLIAMVD